MAATWRLGGAGSGRVGFTLVMLLFVLGCAGAGRNAGPEAGGRAYTAADTLNLDAFMELPASERAARRSVAETWLRRGDVGGDPAVSLPALNTAAGLAPDAVEAWLRLAELQRWLGDYLQVQAALNNAAAVVRLMNDPEADLPRRDTGYQREILQRIALLRAWLHYDRSEYREGAGAIETVLRMEPGNLAALRIHGLLQAGLGNRSRARRAGDEIYRKIDSPKDRTWMRGIVNLAEGRDQEAYSSLYYMRPERIHAAEFHRDAGRVAEQMGDWGEARERYDRSAAALPVGRGRSVTRTVHSRLETGAEDERQVVWLAFGRYYVTGSLSAYTALAMERFEAAEPGPERDFWAGATINAAGIYLRRHAGNTEALRARGLVFARIDMIDRAEPDLQRVAGELAAAGVVDPRLEAALGRIELVRDNARAAQDHLRRALALEAENAEVWSDLGLVLIKLKDNTAALEALTRAVTLDPASPTAWYNRGLLHLHVGRRGLAVDDLAEAARLAPDNQDVALLLQQLRHDLDEAGTGPAGEDRP